MRRLAALTVVALLAAAAPATAGTTQESTFQDDNLLVYGEPATVLQTLDTLRALGADRLRISVFWKVIAPATGEDRKPTGFDAADPATYPPGAWDRYDRLVREAATRGLHVNFNLTGPAPDWATGTPKQRADLDPIYAPDAREFSLFVRAAGRRYSGSYAGPDGTPLPRVEYWSVWNEPNQAGWLAPQWVADPRQAGAMVEASPRIYRELVDAAFEGLGVTGHQDDTILVGETAPKGLKSPGEARSMTPGRFIRRLFCLDEELQPLQGSSAELLGCPVSGDRAHFAQEHRGLLAATGWAHHPYELMRAPSTPPGNPDWFTIGNLDRLQALLRRIRKDHGRAGGIPLYLTEFGYQTNPPDPLGVSPARQARYLDESEFRAWRNPGVRTLAQFLLVDDAPLPGYPISTVGAWGSTFQSGLRTRGGAAKPALRSYRLPIHLTKRSIRRGARLRVWGLARAAGPHPRVDVLLRTTGRERVVRTVTAGEKGYVDLLLAVRRSGVVRLRTRGLDGRRVTSRRARFSVRP